jgi:hypothetical protein
MKNETKEMLEDVRDGVSDEGAITRGLLLFFF